MTKENKIESYVVEFWPKPFSEVENEENLQVTICDSQESAIALEGSFHKIGWPARAMKLTSRIDRLHLTWKPV